MELIVYLKRRKNVALSKYKPISIAYHAFRCNGVRRDSSPNI